jgi:hypothetical protein
MAFSEIVYRGYGPHQRKGGGFSTLAVKSEEELAAALADGWYRTLPEAIDAHDNPTTVTLKDTAATFNTTPADDAPPTRAELEQKARELGIKVHHKHSDATLLSKIDEELGARAAHVAQNTP